jgi:hypothetical protein
LNDSKKDYYFNHNLTVGNLTVTMLEAQEGEKGELGEKASGQTLKKRIKDKIKWKEDDMNKIISSIRNLWKSWNHRIESWKRTDTKRTKKNGIVILERI